MHQSLPTLSRLNISHYTEFQFSSSSWKLQWMSYQQLKFNTSIHPTISSSVAPFSCPQSSPALWSFPMSRLFVSGGQSIGNYLMNVLDPPIDCQCHIETASLFPILFWVSSHCGTRQVLSKCFLQEGISDSMRSLTAWSPSLDSRNWSTGFISRIRRWHTHMFQHPIIIFSKDFLFLMKHRQS